MYVLMCHHCNSYFHSAQLSHLPQLDDMRVPQPHVIHDLPFDVLGNLLPALNELERHMLPHDLVQGQHNEAIRTPVDVADLRGAV